MQNKTEYFESIYKEDTLFEFKFEKYWCTGPSSEVRLNKMLINNYNHKTQMINNKGLSKDNFLEYFLNYGVELDIKEVKE